MNFSQKLGLFILILISLAYVYFSFFNKDFEFPEFKGNNETVEEYNPIEISTNNEEKIDQKKSEVKKVKIFLLDKSGNIRSVNRECNTDKEKSCFEFAIKELFLSPSQWEKSKGFISEIPAGTKLISVRESSGNILLDITSEFETGGGAESTYLRIKQLIKTANSNSSNPVYLYINGKQVNVIGGEGVMLKQPLNDKSLDE